jgi:hypothetical protein
MKIMERTTTKTGDKRSYERVNEVDHLQIICSTEAEG